MASVTYNWRTAGSNPCRDRTAVSRATTTTSQLAVCPPVRSLLITREVERVKKQGVIVFRVLMEYSESNDVQNSSADTADVWMRRPVFTLRSC